MTRGQIAIITPDGKILTSIEFNGDMYYHRDNGHGEEVYEELALIDTEEEYRAFVEKFNQVHFKYNEQLFYECGDSFFDMSADYFDKWFSDYVYIKNLSDKEVKFKDAKNHIIPVDAGETAIFNYGEFYANSEESLQKRLLADELLSLKSNLGYDMQGNYSDLWNLCVDYDNEHSDLYLTDRITEENYVDDELLEYLIKENSTDIRRLRCFIGDTYDDNIYRLDGYGNLANVEKDDFECLIDELIGTIEADILPRQGREAAM